MEGETREGGAESLEARSERLMADSIYSFEYFSKCDGMPLRDLDKRVI